MTVQLTYRSECTILFKSAVRAGDTDDASSVEKSKQIGTKLKDVLTTRTRLEALIRQYNLYPAIVDARGIVVPRGRAEMRLRHRLPRALTKQRRSVISFENNVPDIARQVTEALSESMINEFTSANVNATKQEAEFLAKQEQRSGVDFENANKALATFITVHPEFAVETKMSAFGVAGSCPRRTSRRLRRRVP